MKTDSDAESHLPWTGERYVPGVTGEIELEHVHRYLLAREYADNKDVLDIACGEGFGSAILGETARSVVGVDIAPEAVKHAATRYRSQNIKFRQGSCAQIPLANDTIDLVVSFETIEHHDEHKAMMAEIKRVLRPQGVLIISSPDKKEYSVLPNYHNPFHVRELFKEEFEDLIRAYFKNLALISQRIVYGSGILPETGTFRIADYNIKDTSCSHRGLARARYLIAIASDEDLPFLSGGLLEQAPEESEIVKSLSAENENRARQISALEEGIRHLEERIRQREEQSHSQSSQFAEQVKQLRGEAQQLRGEAQQLRFQSSQFAEQVKHLQGEAEQLNLALQEARRLHQSVTSSLSWRVTWPLRVIRDAGVTSAFKMRRRYNAPLKGHESSQADIGADDNAAKLEIDPQAHHFAALIRKSDLFDAAAYTAAAEASAQGLDPALHYVLMGERLGLKPSSAFDPAYYAELYPDVESWGGNRLGHYLHWGRTDGRRTLPIADTVVCPLEGIQPGKETVLILIHEASRTGAPILGWNIARTLCGRVNVVVVLMQGGRLENSFAEVTAGVVGPLTKEIFQAVEASRLARRLAEIYRPSYVIANSAATRSLVPAFTSEGVPVIALVHEFSSRISAGSLGLLYQRATEIVFSADIVRRASEIDYPFLKLRHSHILPQGPSQVPRSATPIDDSKLNEEERAIRSRLRPDVAKDDLLVVGMGFVEWRKGVDYFIAAATGILSREPNAPVRFVWIGEGYRGPIAMEFSLYLTEQINRSGLGDHFELMDAVDDVESIYKEADILFLSSRLDPLPNVAIDATLRGIPVVCFAEASGIAEILASNEETRELVVSYLDVGAAATLIGSLAADRSRLQRLGAAVRTLAQSRFEMSSYVSALDELGRRAKLGLEQEATDAALILAAGAFDPPLYLGNRAGSVGLAAAVKEYSAIAGKYNYARAPMVHQPCTRRPLAGFHPVTYALQSPTYDAKTNGDPLAHYLRAGRPQGPWTHPVIPIEASERIARPLPTPDSSKMRVLLHAHFHYTDHVADFLRALDANSQHCELILTTNSIEKEAQIRTALGERAADIRVLPNLGRDIAPFLKVLEEAIGQCDLLGHFHGKRSPHVDKLVGDSWRVFLWQHLIGDEFPMVDIIKQAFSDDPKLGLVFPEDPYLVGWDKNREIAQKLAARMGLREPLPATFECPVGTMFWTRPEALAPLLRLGLTPDEYPSEPVPIDGTILHAIERLLPIVAKDAGYHYTTIYFPRFVR
jgi:ubiquinone/menaquinone biosynthesis C-methylase UbiE/glycosyltransferase involved in cell wall biosynthesis